MKKSAWRLAIFAALFAGWIAYLAYLAATTTQPIVLSRPQFLTADLYVVAELSNNPAKSGSPHPEVSVKKVHWSANVEDAKKQKLVILKLDDIETEDGWEGPGEYILALSIIKDKPDEFELTPLPRTPGFPGATGRIYKSTPSTLRQLELITKEFHP